jgi:uncharacterized coiled-coil DUF342 family protein
MNKLFRFGTIVLLAALAAALAPAQTTNPDNATMQALLSEVRQLRLTLEKSVSVGPRMQLILQQAQMQDAKMARISQQLDEVRKQIAAETARQTDASGWSRSNRTFRRKPMPAAARNWKKCARN